MTTDPLQVQTDEVLSFSQRHADVAAGLSGLADGDGIGVETSHGPIAAAVSTALSGALTGRRDMFEVTATRASTISDLLNKAADAYARGDQQDAERFTRAAEVLEGGEPPAPGGTATPAGSGPAGADMAGQMGQILGQVGQQVGQLAQSIAQPLQGLAQGLQQIPQQIMQGVQQAGQRSAGGVDLPGTEEEKDDRRREDEPEKKHETDREESEGGAEASAPASASAERAPADTAAPRKRPAATHPQAD